MLRSCIYIGPRTRLCAALERAHYRRVVINFVVISDDIHHRRSGCPQRPSGRESTVSPKVNIDPKGHMWNDDVSMPKGHAKGPHRTQMRAMPGATG